MRSIDEDGNEVEYEDLLECKDCEFWKGFHCGKWNKETSMTDSCSFGIWRD